MSLIPNGDVRFAEGELQRYHGESRKWVQPSEWNVLMSGQQNVPDFTEGTFWACQYHWYSKGCWSSIYTTFVIAGKETGESFIMSLYEKSSWVNILMAFAVGGNLFPLFALVAAPSILSNPESVLPPNIGNEEVYDQ